jgi:hypothetical protein
LIPRPENRQNPRVVCDVPAVLEGSHGPIRGRCRDISVGGCFFIGPKLGIGHSLELKIDLPAGRIVVMAEVRHHHSHAEGAGMGLKFTRITGDDLARISALIGAP